MVRLVQLLALLVFGSTPGHSQSLKKSTRIVGGSVVTNKDKYSYFALVSARYTDGSGTVRTITCGGSLITSSAVLVSSDEMLCIPSHPHFLFYVSGSHTSVYSLLRCDCRQQPTVYRIQKSRPSLLLSTTVQRCEE